LSFPYFYRPPSDKGGPGPRGGGAIEVGERQGAIEVGERTTLYRPFDLPLTGDSPRRKGQKGLPRGTITRSFWSPKPCKGKGVLYSYGGQAPLR